MKQHSIVSQTSSELSSPWPLDLAECQTGIAPADAPGIHPPCAWVMGSSQHPPEEEGSGCSLFSVHLILGRRLWSPKVPRGQQDVGRASACLLSQAASGVQGGWTGLPSHRRICLGPTRGNWPQTAAAGGWCNWGTVRHRSPAATPPASPSWEWRCREAVCPLPGM